MTFQRPAIQTTLLALLATGCVATHSADDARTSDAPVIDASATDAPSPDAARDPDAFVCPDGDGDGETDAHCGGPDCDDADRNISSTRTLCASPTSVTRCEGAMRVDAVCDAAAPYCDARTNGCVVDACGDRVVHSNEQCDADDLAACVECHRACSSSADCTSGMVCNPGFAPRGEFSLSGCVPANIGGAPFGARCTANSDCYTNVCGPLDGRCTETAAGTVAMCTGPHLWPQFQPVTRYGGPGPRGFAVSSALCAFECEHNDDCAPGATCVPLVVNVPPYAMSTYFVAGCWLDWPHGTVAQGERCGNDHECASGVCVFQRCSQLCRNNADCVPSAPNCVAADRTMPPPEASDDYWYGFPRPAEWGTPFPRVCLP